MRVAQVHGVSPLHARAAASGPAAQAHHSRRLRRRAVAAARRGLAGRKVRLMLDGGEIEVEWCDDGVWMTGPTAYVFSGDLTDAFLKGLG